MTVEELRIGNYVLARGAQSIVKSIDENHIGYLKSKKGEDRIPIKLIKPIPLTEEWLVKFGFEEIEPFDTNADGGYHEERWRHKKTKITLWFYLGNFNACSIEGENEWIDVSHVHQLQNLYFALTQQELTIKN